MKKYIILIAVIICGLNFNSCSKEDNINRTPYYRFDSNDQKNMVSYNYTPNQVIVYENQLGNKMHFRVTANTTKKYGDYSSGTFSGGGGGILESYYDAKIIRLEVVENEANFIAEQVSYIFSKNENNFKSALKFPIWNVSNSYIMDEGDRPFDIDLRPFNDDQKIEITINGNIFKEVIMVESGSDVAAPNAFGALLPNNINQLYYDFNFGIIQFSDIDGDIWKVVNP